MNLKDDQLKSALFIKCKDKQALHRWIKVYLGLDMPDTIISDESNSSPMDFIWEVYSKCIADNDKDFTRVMAYSCREGYKTLSASILEVLLVVHCERSSGHLAALETQAGYALNYVKNFMNKPFLKHFVMGDNKREIEFLRFLDEDTGISYNKKEFDHLPEAIQNKLIKKQQFIKIVICTRAGANGLHAPAMCIDEVDLANPEGYNEAQLIPGPWGVKFPITFLVSTRKSALGLVQKEIDNALESELQIRHWNIIDVTEKCEAERHKPDQPKVDLYVNDEFLIVNTEAEMANVQEKDKHKFAKYEAFAGCAKCPLFSVCKGQLAIKQTKTNKESVLYKPIDFVISNFKKISPEMRQAQLMCRKPETTGLIFPRISRELHLKSVDQILEIMLGHPVENPGKTTKEELLRIALDNDAQFFSGMDFGYTHNFAVVTGFVWGNFMFVVDVISMPNLELDDQMAVCERIRFLDPTIFPDPENRGSIETFRKKGQFRIRQFKKDKGSVHASIETVRMKIKPAVGEPTLFFLKGDMGVEILFKEITKYHYRTDAAGNPTEDVEKIDDDCVDALRYLIMNTFNLRGRIVAAIGDYEPIGNDGSPRVLNVKQQVLDPRDQLNRQMHDIVGNFLENSSEEYVEEEERKEKRQGRLILDL